MKLVNPMGRTAETLDTGANYTTRSGCVCSGSVEVANQHNQGPTKCVGYCLNGVENRQANMEAARIPH